MAAAVPHRSRFSALSRRIILFNGFALVVLIAGVLTVQSRSASLVDERLSGIQQQAQIVAATLAEYTTSEDSHWLMLLHTNLAAGLGASPGTPGSGGSGGRRMCPNPCRQAGARTRTRRAERRKS